MTLETAVVTSPIGPLFLAAADDRLCVLSFGEEEGRRLVSVRFPGHDAVAGADPAGAATALARYFEGDLPALDEIPVDPGGTEFQGAVWLGLRRIPPGRTWTYAQLAQAVGRPRAVRAVGAANGANPIAIVLPCHRVIGSDGHLTGYGGGLDVKAWLLRHEGAPVGREHVRRLPLFDGED